MRRALFASALLAIMAMPVLAQDGTVLFARLDQNADGQVTRAEVIARRTEQFARLDLNGDGAIDQAEVVQLQQSIEATASMGRVISQRQFRQLDADGDGVVTLPEMQVTGRAFDIADRNGDGALSAAEFDAVAGLLGSR